jgi:hypothetical protein
MSPGFYSCLWMVFAVSAGLFWLPELCLTAMNLCLVKPLMKAHAKERHAPAAAITPYVISQIKKTATLRSLPFSCIKLS